MSNKASSGSIGCLTVVGIVFVVLKLLGVLPVAGWSWIWVLSPFWIPAALGTGIVVIALGVAFVLGMKKD